MSAHLNSDYRHCTTRDRGVCIRQTEGQCRDYHHCGIEDCPLASEFGQPAPSVLSRTLSTALGGLWLTR